MSDQELLDLGAQILRWEAHNAKAKACAITFPHPETVDFVNGALATILSLTSELERTREERDSANENRDYWRGRAEPAELEASNLRSLALTAAEREALIWLREWDGQHTPNSETNRAKHVAALDAIDRLTAVDSLAAGGKGEP